MSKSDESEQSCIYLNDSVDEIVKKVKRAKTGSSLEFIYNKATHPEITNLLGIHSALSGESVEQIISRFEGKGYGFESASILKQAAFNEFGINLVKGYTTKDNKASQKLLEKLGFSLKGTVNLPDDNEELLLYVLKK